MECNLSGLENKVDRLIADGRSHEYIAAYVLDFVGRTLVRLTENAIASVGKLPVLYAGGVMSNSIIKKMLANKMNGRTKVHFAEPKFSSDNAAGTALLCAVEEEGVGCLKKL